MTRLHLIPFRALRRRLYIDGLCALIYGACAFVTCAIGNGAGAEKILCVAVAAIACAALIDLARVFPVYLLLRQGVAFGEVR